MRGFHPIDRVALLEEAVRRQMAERERKARKEEASHVRYLLKLKEEYAVRTPILRAAVQRAEGPYQALLTSPEWMRTLVVLSIGKSTPLTALDAPVEAGLRGWILSFGPVVLLARRVHAMAHVATILNVEGSLLPVITWWEEGRSIPQEGESPVIPLNDRMEGYKTVLNLCLLLRRGHLLRVIQSGYVRHIGGSPLRRTHRRI